MLKIRWLMLPLGIAVLFPAILREEIKYAAVAFIIGMLYGLLIDLVGVKVMRLWKYTGQQKQYFGEKRVFNVSYVGNKCRHGHTIIDQ